MINGILVVNHYLHNDKFDDLYNMFITSAHNNNINLSVKTNREINIDIGCISNNKENIDFILFWDKDVLLARHLENLGYLVFNNSEAIRICDDKALTHIELAAHNILMPRTIVSPFTYDSKYNEYNNGFIEDLCSKIGFPMVVKARQGSFGAQVHKVDNKKQLEELVLKYPAGSLLFQEYIATSHGKDVRLQVVGNEVICAMHRYSDTDFRANITNGGKMLKYNPSKEECELAIKASKCLGLDFAGVDLLFGQNNKMLICEINSNAHFRNLYDLTGVNVADEIIMYIREIVLNHKNNKNESMDDI